ncbi:aminotransferase class IV [Sinomicrobium weinanense]|uniref:branched-chain-amino-acid transaminase n=1 Tax=Sinomicrobium weinanense TaxID=2842200 RepID=A0A926Q238_9FLAO|nr:aminotransferase class IV [Sinomicrobium weinanense]MBC9796252.1 aminotransferase class IV [Sinomicrobium weinanense]MBU3122293.1 aminotransferase class IV [Sinomicrobium weinanense]
MINFNGKLQSSTSLFLNHENRGLRYGDALFETLRVVNSKVFFWEEHYLRLMASMRILRMEIPMAFTMEYLEKEILKTIEANALGNKAVRVRLSVYREPGGLYLPESRGVEYIVETKPLESPFYTLNAEEYGVELFKDHWVNSGLLSTLKTSSRLVNILAGIYAEENGYDNTLLLNEKKNVIEAINGNVFLVKGNTIKTPPVNDGCINGILRKQLTKIISKLEGYALEEASISPFELQKADELFITNVITGIRPVTRYRKKQFHTEVSRDLLGKLNLQVRLGG